MSRWIRYGSYPFVMLPSALGIIWVSNHALHFWPMWLLIAAVGIAIVAMLERIQPFEIDWLEDHGDLRADLIHGVVNFSLLSLAATVFPLLPVKLYAAWPVHWPAGLQILLVGVFLDFGLYVMHRLSHIYHWLWLLHAPHHSAERLYWLNGERRHPLSALLLAGPGLLVIAVLGAPSQFVSAWLCFLAIHLAFQHANLDYSLGPFRKLIGVAEIHRWHHKRDYEDAQVNFGEFWMIWDHLFGTFSDNTRPLLQDEVGISDATFPKTYMEQLRYPFIARKNATVVNDK
ncbi:MAG: sterol desaturase family protein [Arenimonas sp.]